MTVRQWIESLDPKALAVSVLIGLASLTALMLLIDRFERIAESRPVHERQWSAATGTELRLSGLKEGPLIAVETPVGEGLTLDAREARLTQGGPARRLVWISEGSGDNKTGAQVRLVGHGGSVTLSRSGGSGTPQLHIKVDNASLQVEAGVTVGPSLEMPETRAAFGDEELSPGRGFQFVVPPGATLSIELPTYPNGMPSGVVTGLGAVRNEKEDILLPVRAVGIAREGISVPDRAVCAAERGYAWRLFFRPELFPVPHGEDCIEGPLTARDLAFAPDAITVSLTGSGWYMEDGKPTDSLWSWAKNNEVLAIVINDLLPAAVGLILGFFAWKRRTGVTVTEGPPSAGADPPVSSAGPEI
jgi:hypothetical protein